MDCLRPSGWSLQPLSCGASDELELASIIAENENLPQVGAAQGDEDLASFPHHESRRAETVAFGLPRGYHRGKLEGLG